MSTFFNPLAIAQLSDRIYVILLKDDKGRLTLLADPGMNQPYNSRNKRLADFHAKECDGMACTWKEAFGLLLKENPGFEKELTERIARRAQDFTKTKLDQNSAQHGINTNPHREDDGTILDSHGNSIRPTDN